tara:strand:+ start:4355 stop:4576 length:222 start_codon:yes stop_codon:yes gene_type:complete
VPSNCWSCSYKKEKQISLFGVCLYFLQIGKEAKEIPDNIVDVGCKHYVERSDDKNIRGTIQMIIELFDGELTK